MFRFATVLYTRFILNLRNVNLGESTVQSHMSSINFAKSVIGNLGAPLEYSIGTVTEQSDAFSQRQTEDPSLFGILGVLPGDDGKCVSAMIIFCESHND